MAERNVKALEKSPSVVIKDFALSNFSGIEATAARRIYFILAMKNENSEGSHEFIRIGRGNVILEFWFFNAALPDEKIIDIAEIVFTRYEIIREALKINAEIPVPAHVAQIAGSLFHILLLYRKDVSQAFFKAHAGVDIESPI